MYLIILDMVDFDIFLSMHWSSLYNAVLDYFASTMTLATPSILRLEWKGTLSSCLKGDIYFLYTYHM